HRAFGVRAAEQRRDWSGLLGCSRRCGHERDGDTKTHRPSDGATSFHRDLRLGARRSVRLSQWRCNTRQQMRHWRASDLWDKHKANLNKEPAMHDAFICDAVRTPIGRYAGALAKVRTDDLAAVPLRALMARHPKFDWSKLDEVYFGCANQAGEDNRNVARMALLLAGLPDNVPGLTLNRLCASGL